MVYRACGVHIGFMFFCLGLWGFMRFIGFVGFTAHGVERVCRVQRVWGLIGFGPKTLEQT